MQNFKGPMKKKAFLFGLFLITSVAVRSEEHTSELQSPCNLVCRLLLEKKNVIVTHGTPGVLAAKQATTTIPIVIAVVGDAVASGLVSSLARPRGNATGLTFFQPALIAN